MSEYTQYRPYPQNCVHLQMEDPGPNEQIHLVYRPYDPAGKVFRLCRACLQSASAELKADVATGTPAPVARNRVWIKYAGVPFDPALARDYAQCE